MKLDTNLITVFLKLTKEEVQCLRNYTSDDRVSVSLQLKIANAILDGSEETKPEKIQSLFAAKSVDVSYPPEIDHPDYWREKS